MQLIAFLVVMAAAMVILCMDFRTLRGKGCRQLWRLGIICTMSFFTILGFLRYESVCLENPVNSITDKSIKNISVTGTVVNKKYTGTEYQLILDNPLITGENGAINIYAHGIRVISELRPESAIGDVMTAKGTLSPLKTATNYGQFDAKEYYECRGIEGTLYADTLWSEEGSGFSFFNWLKENMFTASVEFRRGLESIFPQKEAGILSAMLTGERSGIEEEIRELYSAVGIAHILSISGLHITLLGMGIFKLLMLVLHRLRLSVILTVILMLLYGVFTGFSTATERAVIMLICLLLAKAIGRAYDGQSAGALAALIILIKEPRYIYDTGFLLSFFAVFGIFAGNEILRGLKTENVILRYCIPGLFAQLAVFPILLFSYYSFSPYGIIVNMLLLPLMSIIILSGFLAGIAGVIYNASGYVLFDFLGRITGGSGYYILEFYEKFSKKVLELPYSRLITGVPKLWQAVIYYLLFFTIVYLIVCRKIFEKKEQGSVAKDSPSGKKLRGLQILTRAAAIIALIPVMLTVLLYRPSEEGVYVCFLDVGQGQCIYIEADGLKILVDGGSTDRVNAGKNIIAPYLMYKGISGIDISLVTHTDSDHTNGLKELLEDNRIAVGRICLGNNITSKDSLIALAEKHSIPVEYLSAGDILDGIMTVISPDDSEYYPDDNSASLVALLEYEELQLLITGDSDAYAESLYLSRLNGSADIIQVPHHGSKYSSSQELLDTLKPKIAIISCSKYNSYGHPAPEILERYEACGSSLYKTFECGMLELRYCDGKISVNGKK